MTESAQGFFAFMSKNRKNEHYYVEVYKNDYLRLND